MKKSVSHLLYPIIMMIAAMNFTISCTDEPETEKQAELPVLEDLTVAVGQTGTIDFNAPLAWTISSDKEWFALGGEQGETSGEAGQQSVPYTVTDQDADFEKTTEANVRIVFSDDRYITFKVTRGTLDRTMTITSDEEGTTPIESIDMDNTMLSYQNMRTFYVSANYDWYYDAAGSSDWIVLSGGSLEGKAGETCAVSVYIDQDKAPVEAGTGRIVLSSYDNEPVTEELTVNFGGFGQGYWKIVEVRNGQEFANAYGGCTFSSDGFISQAGMATDQNSVTLKLRSSEKCVFVIATKDATWGGNQSGIYFHYAYPHKEDPLARDNSPWLTITSVDTKAALESGIYTITVEKNEPQDDMGGMLQLSSWQKGTERIARVLCIPESLLQDAGIINDNGMIYQSKLQGTLAEANINFETFLREHTLREEFSSYVAFEVIQEASAGTGSDTNYMTLKDLAYAGTLIDLGEGNYRYETDSYQRGMNFEAQFGSLTGIAFKSSEPNTDDSTKQDFPYVFTDCDWLLAGLADNGNGTYSLNIRKLKNETGAARSYKVVLIDGSGTEVGSITIEQGA